MNNYPTNGFILCLLLWLMGQSIAAQSLYDPKVIGYDNCETQNIDISLGYLTPLKAARHQYRLNQSSIYARRQRLHRETVDKLCEIDLINGWESSYREIPKNSEDVGEFREYHILILKLSGWFYYWGKVSLNPNFESHLILKRVHSLNSLYLLNIKNNYLLSVVQLAVDSVSPKSYVAGVSRYRKGAFHYKSVTTTDVRKYQDSIKQIPIRYADFCLDDNGQVVILPDSKKRK